MSYGTYTEGKVSVYPTTGTTYVLSYGSLAVSKTVKESSILSGRALADLGSGEPATFIW